MAINQTTHTLDLARELLDDVELSRLPAEQLLLKASRLSRLVDDATARTWLLFELNGYPGTIEARSHAFRFGRIKSLDAEIGFWQPLAGISGAIASSQTQLQQLNIPNVHFAPSSANPLERVTGFSDVGTMVSTPVNAVLTRLQGLTNHVSDLTSIRSRVLSAIHDFAARVYYERAFTGLAETIFEKHKALVDGVISVSASDVIEKLPAIYDRLAVGDKEATSQALNSVRRMIRAFADSVYPAGEGTRELNGQAYQIGSDKILNRIKLYLAERCRSASRRDRLSHAMRDIYDRASAGAHSDVTADEARALFLHAYLTIGESITATTETEPPTSSTTSVT
jgi:hypothetical protein